MFWQKALSEERVESALCEILMPKQHTMQIIWARTVTLKSLLNKIYSRLFYQMPLYSTIVNFRDQLSTLVPYIGY